MKTDFGVDAALADINQFNSPAIRSCFKYIYQQGRSKYYRESKIVSEKQDRQK